jgi:hypothetical protein
MNIYLANAFNQLKQVVAYFSKDSLPVILVKNAAFLILGWNATAKTVDYISKYYPFINEGKTPISVLGAFSMVLLSCSGSIGAAGTAAMLAYIALAPTGVKTVYSPEEFKKLLLKKHPFPPNIIVIGDLNLSDRTELISLPERLTVKGNLNLFRCTGLTSLPEGLTVEYNLNLCDCTGLTSLPERLTVGRDLYLSGCTGLTSLLEELTVGGDLYFFYCTGLTSLPNWITTLGPRADGNTRQIHLEGIGLSEALLNRLRQTFASGIQFYSSNAASVPTVIFPDLSTALTFWVTATNDETLINPPMTIAPGIALRNVLAFLSRLTETAEYKNLEAKPLLAKRVIEAFSLMAENESIKGRAFDLMHQGLTSCDDRTISALEEIELMVLLHKIENTSRTEAELRALGKSFLLLEMVNEKAKAHKSTLTWVDEIEIYLAFQIGLAEKLNLPVKTRNMIFRRCAQITDEQINQAGVAVLTECTEERLNNFLKSWSPWIEHQRKNSSVPTYEDLPVVERKLKGDEICPIMQDIPEKPVLCGNRVYDYDALIKWSRMNDNDPIDRSKIDLKKLERMEKKS